MVCYEIEQIRHVCSKYTSIKKVILFGSRARGDNNERSDFDIAIYALANLDNSVLLKIDEIETLLKIDVTVITANKYCPLLLFFGNY